jgi:HEAT repeat protein
MAKLRTVSTLVGAALLCSAAPRVQERDVAAEIETILTGIERPADVIGMRDALVQVAGERLDLLFACLGTEADPLRLAALIAALDKLPRDAVLAHLAARAREPMAEDERRSALDLLARMGRRSELKLCLELAGASTAGAPLETSLREGLERALAGICEREPTAPRALATYFSRSQPALQTVIADVIAERGDDEALPLLAELLEGATPQTASLLLLAIGGVAQHTDYVEDLLALERVRGFLGHPDEGLAVLACLAVEKLRDHEAVPDLIVLLEDGDMNLRRRAHATLCGLTGLGMPAEAEPWIVWLDESLTWWEERAEPCRIALVSGTPAEAAAAVLEVAGQRLFVHEVVQLLALGLQRPETDIAKSACRALGTIPESRARRALARLALHPDPELAELALAAIERQERSVAPSSRPSPIRFPSRSANP